MPTNPTCPRCGNSISANAPAGLCPRCLLQNGVAGGIIAATAAERPANSQSMSSSVASSAGVLKSLDETIGHVPRVLLRDAPAEQPRPALTNSEHMPEQVGNTGRYQLLGEIARGGMGVVLKGRDVDVGRDVAVKVLLEKHRDNPEMVRRFVEEAQIAGQLQHPGIVPVYELGRLSDGRLYIAMKLIRGSTLAAILEVRSNATEDLPRCLAAFEQVCQTMAYAHACGVIHRDLKPSNVMVGSFGEVQVMDWGLAKVLDIGGVADERRSQQADIDADTIRTWRSGSTAQESQPGSVLGTPSYMPPEQARGRLETLDERADVFGLGAILCEILTGKPPFWGNSGDEAYQKSAKAELSEAIERLDACGADIELVALAKSCLAVIPKERPRDAKLVASAMTAYLEGVQQRLKSAELARARAESRAVEERKRRMLVVGLATSLVSLLLVVGGGAAWISWQRAARTESTMRETRSILHETSLLLARARSSKLGDLASWAEVAQAAKRAEAQLARTEIADEQRQEIRDLIAMVEKERKEAEELSKDRLTLQKLAAIKDEIDRDYDYRRADREHAKAFREYGIDIDKLTPEDAAALIAASPIATELVNGLDQWTFVRRIAKSPKVAELSHIAKLADPDPWRCRLRDALDLEDADQKASGEIFTELAESVPGNTSHLESISRLAFALKFLGEKEKAAELLRSAQRANPSDFWINVDLASTLLGAGRAEEAVRFYTAAIAIRPDSKHAKKNLQQALKAAGQAE